MAAAAVNVSRETWRGRARTWYKRILKHSNAEKSRAEGALTALLSPEAERSSMTASASGNLILMLSVSATRIIHLCIRNSAENIKRRGDPPVAGRANPAF
jgi:hypothetical protein